MKKRRNPFTELRPASRKQLLNDIFLLLLGALLQAAAYAIFIAPAGIVPGGVYGISIAINHLSKGVWDIFPNGLPIGVVAYFFNIPLFLLAARSLGLSSGAKTIATFLSIGLFTDLITTYITHGKPIIEDDPFLASVYGGAILGLGVFLTFKVGSTSAGTDVLARVLSKGRNIKTSNLIIFVDAMVILFGLIVFGDLKVPLYSLVTIVVYGKVLDLMSPENPNKAVFIVSENPHQLRDIIVEQLGLRATYLHGQGMYAGVERDTIFMIVERKHLAPLKRLVLERDPKAFIATTNATNDTLPPLI
ncbi:hypothetical protein HQ36_01695 [Porphyromonas gingivicanis]|uniref:DUF2179 domain-containing protein n=1 Tax=Porphyromonas gingivicanis TaxID=266762 RepID=A0A0A2G9T6_9PORP|nr:YitT family protein [Porphyromonas gingivicanis]KGN99192.1 hypothetical protein HQ36_01695 [Porphyromonas gingivicanis]